MQTEGWTGESGLAGLDAQIGSGMLRRATHFIKQDFAAVVAHGFENLFNLGDEAWDMVSIRTHVVHMKLRYDAPT